MVGIKQLLTNVVERFGFISRKSWSSLFTAATEAIIFKDQLTKPYAQVPSVYKAVKALCDNIPQAELVIRDWSTQEESESPAAKQIMDLFNKPNPKQSQHDFIQEVAGFFSLYGEVLILKTTSMGQISGTRNLPAAIEAFNPEKCAKIKDQSGTITAFRINNVQYPAESVIHIKDFNPYDKNEGLKPCDPMGKLMQTDWLTDIYNKAFFDNNGAPPYALSSDKNLTEIQRQRIEEWLKQEHAGARNAHKTPVLESGLKPIPFGSSHKDMDFLEQKKFNREEILGNWRAPKALFNITDDLNYATFQGQVKVFWLYGIAPILRKIEDSLTRHLIAPFASNLYLEFDIKNVPAFQQDLAEKHAAALQMFQMGVPLNAINEKLDLGFDKFEWGDMWWVPIGLHEVTEKIDFGTTPSEPGAGNEEPAAAEEKGLNDDTRFNPVKYRLWKNFLTKQAPVEKRLEKVIGRFLFEQRGRVLAHFYAINPPAKAQTKAVVQISMDWSKEALALIERVTPYIFKSMMEGIELGASLLPSDKADMKLLQSMAVANADKRAERLHFVTDTMNRQVSKVIDDGIKAGKTTEAIADDLRRQYNIAGNRSMLIARTESTGAVNGGSIMYYESIGVTKGEWVTAHDERVRQSHVECENSGARRIGSTFPNGLRYPGDPLGDISEVANCRCSYQPIA